MKPAADIIGLLKRQGSKITKARLLLIEVLQKQHSPLTETELRFRLSLLGAKVNKTTVYRELAHLKAQRIVHEIDFGDGKKRYELASSNHHHHAVCLNCKKIEDVPVGEDVAHIEKRFKKQRHFQITSHSLEFFGLCKSCSAK